MGHEDIAISVHRKLQPPRYRFETRAYQEGQLIYVSEGRLYFRGNKQETWLPLTPGMFVMLRADDAFTLCCREAGYKGLGVALLGTLPAALRGESITGTIDSRSRLLTQMAFHHMDAPVAESAQILTGLGRALAWEVLALARERHDPGSRDWAAAARTVLELNLGTGIPVRQALASIPLSYRQLCRCFRERYGASPKTFQQLLRIDESRRMLSDTQMHITAVAIELGYASSQHFASQFRHMVGCTPSEYRRGDPVSSEQ